MPDRDPDGVRLLTGEGAGELLRAAVERAGGALASWRLDHVDTEPGRATTATYTATVEWAYGARTELVGASVRAHGPRGNDQHTEIFDDGRQQVAVWIHPFDPDLPALPLVAFPESVARLVAEWGVVPHPVAPDRVRLRMLTYRPRRRAVVRADIALDDGPVTLYLKVLPSDRADDLVARHRHLLAAGLPVPEIVATASGVVALRALPGSPLGESLYLPAPPVDAAQILDLLAALPTSVLALPRRPPWSESLEYYAEIVARTSPGEQARLAHLTRTITDGLGGPVPDDAPTHGDFHEGQLQVAGGRIVGLLDVDTLGPGRRVDDLACLVAHLSTVQRMSRIQAERLQGLLDAWVPVFDRAVDPAELRLRSAAVAVSLATGPFRAQDPDWQEATTRILDAAERLVRQVG